MRRLEAFCAPPWRAAIRLWTWLTGWPAWVLAVPAALLGALFDLAGVVARWREDGAGAGALALVFVVLVAVVVVPCVAAAALEAIEREERGGSGGGDGVLAVGSDDWLLRVWRVIFTHDVAWGAGFLVGAVRGGEPFLLELFNLSSSIAYGLAAWAVLVDTGRGLPAHRRALEALRSFAASLGGALGPAPA